MCVYVVGAAAVVAKVMAFLKERNEGEGGERDYADDAGCICMWAEIIIVYSLDIKLLEGDCQPGCQFRAICLNEKKE